MVKCQQRIINMYKFLTVLFLHLLSATRKLYVGGVCFFVCQFVCLFATLQKSYEWMAMKFYGRVWGVKRNKSLNFGANSDNHVDCPVRNPVIIQQIISI